MKGLNYLITVLLVCSVWATSGCERAAKVGKGESQEGLKFAVSYQTINNPFFKDLNRGLENVIKERGDRLDVFDTNFDAKIQKRQISDILQGGYHGIFLNPVDWKGIERSLLEAKDAEVPVVVIDAPVEDADLALTIVASDNFKAGKLAGEALKRAKPQGAKIAVLAYPPNKACRDRVAGFKAAIETPSDGGGTNPYEIVVEEVMQGATREAAYPIMKDIIQRAPEISAVFAINDPSAFGAIRALDQANKLEQVTVLAVDGNAKALEEVAAGRLLGTSAQFPEEIGLASARALYDHLDGKVVPPEIKIRVEFIDSSNVNRFRQSSDRS